MFPKAQINQVLVIQRESPQHFHEIRLQFNFLHNMIQRSVAVFHQGNSRFGLILFVMIKRQMLCDLAQPVIAFLRFVVCVNIAERPHERFRYHVFRIFGMIQVPPRYAEQMAGGNFEKLFAFRQVAVFDLF